MKKKCKLKKHTWLKALPLLKEGKGIRRLGWDKKRFPGGDDEVFLHNTEIVGITYLFLEDFESKDWVEFIKEEEFE